MTIVEQTAREKTTIQTMKKKEEDAEKTGKETTTVTTTNPAKTTIAKTEIVKIGETDLATMKVRGIARVTTTTRSLHLDETVLEIAITKEETEIMRNLLVDGIATPIHPNLRAGGTEAEIEITLALRDDKKSTKAYLNRSSKHMPIPAFLLVMPLVDASAACEVREVKYCVYHASLISCATGRRVGDIHEEHC